MELLIFGVAAFVLGGASSVAAFIWALRRDLFTTLAMAAAGRPRGDERWGHGGAADVPHTLPGEERLNTADDRHELQRVWAELS